ncbi:MAG: penicillin acylase family protein [Gemmatimonadota bacterium]|nr:MAG: penicillin acylase family protein [Gemmatimonadota bacterium]
MARSSRTAHLWAIALPLTASYLLSPTNGLTQTEPYDQRVEIRRTAYGVPHILAEDLGAAFFGLAYCHLEDYGEFVIRGLIETRGELARYFGPDSLDADFRNRQTYARAQETYHLLDPEIREVFQGYAAGVNHYIELHPEEFPDWVKPKFTGHDVAAHWIEPIRWGVVRNVLRRLAVERANAAVPEEPTQEGSNAWAFAPSRTKSGKAILLRNPHLNWDAGYYEAHITVPGLLNFYGDFRVGYPLYFNGGFNQDLGWATTNNGPDLEEIYALQIDPERPDHYLFDGASVPLRRETITVEFKNGEGLGRETREFWHTPLGPVVERRDGKIYIVRAAGNGEYRAAHQFLRMMKATNLEEWRDAMRMRAQLGSNFTYADREGNIFYLWNATIPSLPRPSGGDTAAVPATVSADVWTTIVDFESLPQVRNPRGGYLHNENDPFHYSNLNQPLDPDDFPANFPQPDLGLRSQHSLQLIHNNRKFSLEDIVELKHSQRMLLADRVKDDLLVAVRGSAPEPEVASAIDLIASWDNTVAPDSRGGVLFEIWFRRYLRGDQPDESFDFGDAWDAAFQNPWSTDEPTNTPRGLSDPQRAAVAFAWAVQETKKRFGSWDVSWGDVHRIRMGDLDIPVGGCSGLLGCFRVMWFEEAEDGKLTAAGGDGWVLAVEFGKQPRAFSVLAYGQSSKEESPHFNDQAEMFARHELKRVAFTEHEIEAQLIRRYRPGEELQRDR